VRKEVEKADRKGEVRAAARSWHRSGAIDRGALETIVREYEDDRSRARPAFRVLLFLFTFVAVVAAFGLLAIADVPTGALLFLTALGCIALTEIQMGPLRRWCAGTEEATAVLALGFTSATFGRILDESGGPFPWRVLVFATALLAVAGAWRWGMSVFGALAALCVFALVDSRLGWILLGAAFSLPLAALSTADALAPSQRRAAQGALVVSIGGLYLALNLASYDRWLIERGGWFLGFYADLPEASLRWGRPLFGAATAIVPLVVLAAGIRFRRPLLLRMGVVLGVASLVTVRLYVHVAPLWVVLIASGGLAIAGSLVLLRYLGSGQAGERYGVTGEPLFGGGPGGRVVELGLSAALSPGTSSSSREPGFRGGGGDFGGGGASGSY
jgi:hypothetical protein